MPSWLGILLRGVAMGAADVVPGVSGGTIALITGIYDRLLGALASIDGTLLAGLLRGRIREAWHRVDGQFLVLLFSGVGFSVLVLARVIDWCLRHYPQPLWSFFLGLVLASSVFLARQELSAASWSQAVLLVLGCLMAVAVALSPGGNLLPGLAGFFFAGALAICAMILPGISGSFILLLLGMYQPVISAVAEFRWLEVGVFMTGCGLGLLGFSRFLHWLLDRYRGAVMALLTGFLAGSMVALWPWRVVLTTVIDRHGDSRPLQQAVVTPSRYASEVGDPMLLACCVAMLVGVCLTIVTHRWTNAARV